MLTSSKLRIQLASIKKMQQVSKLAIVAFLNKNHAHPKSAFVGSPHKMIFLNAETILKDQNA